MELFLQDELLPLLRILQLVARRHLPADAAVNKVFKAVKPLIEKILQVPAPGLGLLQHADRKKAQLCQRPRRGLHVLICEIGRMYLN